RVRRALEQGLVPRPAHAIALTPSEADEDPAVLDPDVVADDPVGHLRHEHRLPRLEVVLVAVVRTADEAVLAAELELAGRRRQPRARGAAEAERGAVVRARVL